MRLLLINPNMTVSLTDSMAGVARQVAGDRAEIVALTAPRGFPYIASRAEAQIAGAIALEMIAENLSGIDAVILAAFGDPGLVAAREIFDVPVIGMAEAAILSAAMLGERFSIVTFSPVMRRWYSDSVAQTGLSARFTGVRTPATHDPDVLASRHARRDALVALARDAAQCDGADVVILGGAPLAGLAPEISPEIPAVVLDPIAAATVQAMALAGLRTSGQRRAARPVGKASVGLAPALAQVIALD
ncbi:aspartate/glutamate racemase family protein [Citreicella sp. C3M06]|uniref:aspartate/glutamate racemase family protein n=1 Tax=Citreicella sp. C3M06 TaxID=2841564 RepID=UPI001C084DDA|nr:aspartate/glutamate racemase family protein [Citreicella sp. C3M06]MBU2963138.1 aspartate/glutamate racemase family protein [Citreicella sp. C3M06]